MGHGKVPPIPDYKIFKVDGIKHLEWTRKALAEKGLKDPWLRNEVWRYKSWDGFGKSALYTLTRGLKYAVVAMAVTIAVDKAFGLHDSPHGHSSDH